jgi:hypothetical protein
LIKELSKYIYLYKNKKVLKHIDPLLDLINLEYGQSINTESEKISHTDWNNQHDNREYVKYFFNNVFEDFAKELIKHTNQKGAELDSIWFQHYCKGDYHNLHTHPKSNFSNVFYLKANKNQTTHITDCPPNRKFIFEVEAGDILIFPAFLPHQSLPNKEEDKIVISFHLNLIGH